MEKIEIRDKKELYSPGDKLTVDVTFRPWRKDAVVKPFELTVPEHAMAFCEVPARGGGIEEPVQEPLVTGTRAITSFKELIRELSAKEANNQLIVEIGGPEDPTEGKDEKAERGKNSGRLASDAPAGKDGGTDKAGKAGAQRGKKDAKESFSPADLLEDRFVSEIKAERIKSGALVIADTNYYVDGVQRTFIKIKPNAGGEEMSDEQLAALDAGLPEQPDHVAGILTGLAEDDGWMGGKRPVDWSDAVEAVRRIAGRIGAAIELDQPAADDVPVQWHPGRAARVMVGDVFTGRDGALHPRVNEALGFPALSAAFVRNLTALFATLTGKPVQAMPISSFPPV